MLEIPPWLRTSRAVMVGRGMMVGMPWGWRWKQKFCVTQQALQLLWSWGVCYYIPSFFPQITINCLIDVRNWWSARGKGKTWSHGAENQLVETELDMLTNRGKEKAGSAGEGRAEKDCEETEEVQMQPQPSPAGVLLRLQHFRIHSSCVLCKKKGTCSSGSSQCTRPEHLSHASHLGWWSVSL